MCIPPAPTKVIAFTWKMILNKIQTKQSLCKKNIRSNNMDNLCTFCNQVDENTTHLLFSCRYHMRYRSFLTLGPDLNRHYTIPQHVGTINGSNDEKTWWGVWLATMWLIIMTAKEICDLQQWTSKLEHVVNTIKFSSWSWLKVKLKGFRFHCMIGF